MKRLLVATALAAALGAAMVLALPAQASIFFIPSKASFDSVVSTTLIEDFEVIAPNPKDTPLASLSQNGVTYTPFAGAPFFNVFDASPGYTNFGLGANPTTSSILTANGDEDFSATFAIAQKAVGFDTYLNGLGPATIKVYSGATLLDTFTYVSATTGVGYMGIYSDAGAVITSFRFTSTLGGVANTGVDNISVTTPVPEPSTYAMLIAGMAMVGFMARRRMRR